MKGFRIFSVIFVLMLASALLCSAVCAEELSFDIPVIEEIAEAELEEIMPEEGEVELFEESTATYEAEIWDDSYTTRYGQYLSFEEAVAAIASYSGAGTPTIKLLSDVLLDSNATEGYVLINHQKTFIVDGDGHKITDGNPNVTSGSISMKKSGTKLIAKNVTFTRNYNKSYAFFWLSEHAILELSDNSKIGGTSDAVLPGGNGAAVFIGDYNAASNPNLIMSSDSAVIEYCDSGRGAVSIFRCNKSPQFSKGTIKNCKGTNGVGIGIDKATAASALNFGENFLIENCKVGIAVRDRENSVAADVTLNGITIKDCTTGFDISGKPHNVIIRGNAVFTGNTTGINVPANSSVDIQGNLTISGGTTGINVADGGLLKLNSPVSVTENTGSQINVATENLIEIGEGFTGKAYISIPNEKIHIGHLAEGATKLNGTVYLGSDSGYKSALYKSLLGSGTETIKGKTYTLKKSITKDFDDSDILLDYPMYIRTGNENDGYVRKGLAAITTQNDMASGSTIFFLKDITFGEDFKLSTNKDMGITGGRIATLNGNGHKLIASSGATAKTIFAVYGLSHLKFENVIYDGGGASALAYIYSGSGGGTISAVNSILHSGLAGTGSMFYSYITKVETAATGTINITDSYILNGTGSQGAIYTYCNTTVNMTDSSICENTTTATGGAICCVNSSTVNFYGINSFENCTSTSSGGGALFLGGTANIEGTLNIKNCTAKDVGGGIYMSSTGVLNVENTGVLNINGNTSGGQGAGIYFQGGTNTKVNLNGKANITGNSKSDVDNNIYLNGTGFTVYPGFTGTISVYASIDNLAAGEGFTELESIKSILFDNTNEEWFAYYDSETKKFAGMKKPVLTCITDSGKYSDGKGVIRFMSTFGEVNANGIKSFGTYAVGTTAFDETASWKSTQYKEFSVAPAKDKAFIVDLVKIPEDSFGDYVNAVSFVKLKGIKTPVYYNFNSVSVNKNDTKAEADALKELGAAPYAA